MQNKQNNFTIDFLRYPAHLKYVLKIEKKSALLKIKLLS